MIAALAGLLTLLAGRPGGRPAAALIALLGTGALAVTVGVDLPDAHATGLVVSDATTQTEAQAHAAIGLYLETLGAVALLAAGVVSALLGRRVAGGRSDGPGSTPASPAADVETRGLPTARDRGLR